MDGYLLHQRVLCRHQGASPHHTHLNAVCSLHPLLGLDVGDIFVHKVVELPQGILRGEVLQYVTASSGWWEASQQGWQHPMLLLQPAVSW